MGNIGSFEVDTNYKLHLNDSIANISSLVTQSQAIINGEWIFDVKLDLSPSTIVEIKYKDGLKTFEIINEKNINNFEDDYSLQKTEFLYEESKYFNDVWLKTLIKGYIKNIHSENNKWGFINWYSG